MTSLSMALAKILGPKLRANGFNFFEVFRHFNWGGFPQL
jgi:hypothetical protein